MHIIPFDQSFHLDKLLTWFQDAEIMKGMGMEIMDLENLRAWTNDGKIILMAIEGDNPVGMINFYHYKTSSPQVEVGYLIDPNYQGKGFATELLRQGIEYLSLNHPGISEITETYVEDFNSPSKRVLEKNGFKMYLHRPEKQRSYYKLKLS